jgi:telomerase protein component 1
VSVGWDFAVKLWNGITGEYEGDLATDQRPLNCIVMHPDSQLVAVGCWDATVKLFDVFRKERKAVWRGHTSSVRDVAFTLSGRHLASAALDGEVHLWFTATGSHVGTFRGHSGPVNQLRFTAFGHELVTASDDHTLKVWSSSLGRPVAHVGHKLDGVVNCVVFNHDGRYVAAGYHSGHVRFYDVTAGMVEWTQALFSDPVSVNCLKFSLCTDRIVAGTANGTVLVLDSKTGSVQRSFQGHPKSVLSIACGSLYLVTTSEDFEVHLYKTSTVFATTGRTGSSLECTTLSGHLGPVSCCSFNSTETMLAAGSRDMSVIIWNLKDGDIHKELVLSDCHADWITCCAWSSTNDFLVTGSNDFNLKLWDTKSGHEKVKMTGHLSSITGVAYDHGCIVSSSFDGSIKVWSHRGVEITTLQGHAQRAGGCDLHVKITKLPEAADVQLENSDWGTVMDEEDWKQKHEETKVRKNTFKVESVMVASCSDDGTIRVWLPTLSNELSCLTGHTDKVLSLVCSCDGIICSSSLDHTVKLWKLETGSLNGSVTTSDHHDAEVTAVACSKDGSHIATASRDGVVKIWLYQACSDASNCLPKICTTVKAHTKSVNCLEFLSNQSPMLLATGSDDASVAFWKVFHCDDSSTKMKKLISVNIESPVTSLLGQTIGKNMYIIVTQWNKYIKVLRLNDKGEPETSISVPGHTDWCLTSVCLLRKKQPLIVSAGADQTLIAWKLNEDKLQLTKVSSWQVEAKLSDSKMTNSNWLTSLAVSGSSVYIGDSHGQLTELDCNAHIKSQKKLHKASVSSIVTIGSHILTSSHDQTIKIWNSDLDQVGLYVCSSPVTSLKLVPDSDTKGPHHQIVVGTQLGELLFLCLTPSVEL